MLLSTQAATPTLPQVHRSPITEGPRRSGGPSERRKQARILIVDDEVPLARGIARIAGSMGHKAEISGPMDAIKMFKEAEYDLVISDLNMPEINGLNLTSKILELKPTARVIIHTANGHMSREDLMSTGACDVIYKPAEIQIVKETIERNLKR